MKKRLLSFFAFALMTFMVNAQSWTKPEIKLTTDQVPDKAYIYNVEQKQFLSKGGAWGTHAAITPVVSNAFLYELQDQGEGAYIMYCAAAANTGRLGRNSDTEVYTDFKSGDWATTWSFIKNETTGYYRIRTAANDTHYGADKYTEDDPVNCGLYELGWNENGEDLTNGNGDPMGTNVGCYMQDPDNAEGWSLDWAFMTEENYAIYNAQTSLYDKLVEAFEEGYSEAELAEQAALLSSTDVEAINAATAQVQQLILDYGYNHATPENPFDVTGALKNPTFEGARNAEPEGWIDEFSNMKIQNNKAYHIWDDEADVESDEYGFNNFSQNWTSSNDVSCGASHIYQTLTDLPQGTYILQADAIATSASASLIVNGAELYARSGSARYACPIDKNAYGASGSGMPHRYELLLTHMGGDLTVGLELSADGYAKWFGCDNFKLYYAGPVDNPGLVALASALEAAQPYLDYYAEESKYYYSETTKEQLETLLSDSQGLTESEECLEAAGKLNDLIKSIKAEVATYGKLAKFVEQVKADAAKYPFIEALSELQDACEAAYDDKTATTEQVNAWMESYDQLIKDGIKKELPNATEENPIELTGLFANLGFEENTTESASPTNWTCDAGAFKARANTAEVWQATFDAYVTLADLPAGAYKITAHGLARSGSSVDNYNTNGEGITAEFYANNASVKVKNQSLGASTEKLYTNDVNLTEDEENPLWAPNSMEGARVYFNVENTPYVNEITANLINDGDPLRIGFRDMGNGDGTIVGNSWTIWSDVRVYYIGVNKNALYEEMLNVVASAESKMQSSLVDAAITKLNDAVEKADKMSPSDSEEAITAVINELAAAIDYCEQGKALVAEVMNLSTSGVYDEVLNNYEVSVDSELTKILDEMNNAIADEAFESNEQIEGWLKALPAARTAHIFASVVTEAGLTPSEDEPADVTDVMTNPSFATNNATGWTITNTGGSVGGSDAQRTGSTAYEMWNGTAFDIHQVVPGLPEGYYSISCKALFRNGNNADDLAATYFADPAAVNGLAKFYANDINVNVKSIYEDAQTEDPALDGQTTYVLDGATYYTPNTMISFEKYAMELDLYNNKIVMGLDGKTDLKVGLCYETTAQYAWFPFDDFKIAYLGTTAPTAIKGIEAGTVMAGKVAIYNVNGQQQNRLQKGVNIVRKADGKVVKLLVK